LSDLAGPSLETVLFDLECERQAGLCARVFGRRYMELRRGTEELLRSGFIEAGGRPERTAPHYFVLGTSPWFGGLARDMDRVVLPLAALPTDVASVTYPDSVTAMALGPAYGLPHEPRPYHGRVYRLEELPGLIGSYGLPTDVAAGPDDYEGYHHRPFEKYIEVQLWSDRPLRSLLTVP